MELIGGEIGVTSEPRRGSTFWFTVAFRSVEPPADQVLPRANLHGLKTLVIDDNATNRLVLEQNLKAWGVAVESAADGASGLDDLRRALARGEPFDLAILDFHVPGMDGIELAGEVERLGVRPRRWLVLLTSTADRGDARAARRAGIDAYLTKPGRQSALYDALTAVTGSSEWSSQPSVGPAANVPPSLPAPTPTPTPTRATILRSPQRQSLAPNRWTKRWWTSCANSRPRAARPSWPRSWVATWCLRTAP